MTDFENGVIEDIVDWVVDNWDGKSITPPIYESIDEYWQDYFNSCSMGDTRTGLETI
jgi:hypothetical protein